MKNKIIITSCVIVFLLTGSYAQNPDDILRIIATNNKEIKVNEKYYQALILDLRTGLNPSDPSFEYGYYPGNSNAPGAKRVVGLTQNFDFPTSYNQKKKLTQKYIDAAKYRMNDMRQNVLLEAKHTIVDLIYIVKVEQELLRRKDRAESLFAGQNRKFELGETSILDFNKAKTELLIANNKMNLNTSSKKQLQEKIVQLNGGQSISLLTISYPSEETITLQNIIEETLNNDPGYLAVHIEKDAANRNIKVQKTLYLPKITVGYGSETVVDESFIGGKLGLTFPLWERKNTVKQAISFADYAGEKVNSYTNKYTSGIKLEYERAKSLKISLDEYQQLIDDLQSEELLTKALDLGHISLIEYLLELKYYYDTLDTLLELERDYFKSLATLYKYRL